MSDDESQIATIKEQIASINQSLTSLDGTDTDLHELIAQLQATSKSLNEAIAANKSDIENAKAELEADASADKLEVLEALTALGDELQGKLDKVNIILEDLQNKDAALEGQIKALKEYVNGELKNAKDWASATFSTIEQYNATVTQIAGIKADIEAVSNVLNEKFDNLDAKIESTADNLKEWVNSQLTQYYTIAQIDAKVALLEKSIKDGDESAAEEIKKLRGELESQKQSITSAYQSAISEAISTNNGIIDGKIQTAVSEVNARITSELATINATFVDIYSRLNGIDASISEIMSMIQSIAVIPTFSNNEVAVAEDDYELYFEIRPVEAAKKLVEVGPEAFTLKAVSTLVTKSDIGFVTLPVKAVAMDEDLLVISTDGENIPQEFFVGGSGFSASLSVTDGLNNISSPYFVLSPQGDAEIIKLKIAECRERVVEGVDVIDNTLFFRFIDGTVVELPQNTTVPYIYLTQDESWSISFDNGENITRLMDGDGHFVQYGSNCNRVRLTPGDDGFFKYQIFAESSPESSLAEIGTTCRVDTKNSVKSLTFDEKNYSLAVSLLNGESFEFSYKRIVPESIGILNNKIRLASNCEAYFEFRVNPSDASFNYDLDSEGNEIELDLVGEATKASSYVTSPTNYKLTRVEQVYDAMGNQKKGQYRAYVTDLNLSTDYDDLVSLVLTINNGAGKTVQISSSALEIFYSTSLITAFRFEKANNPGLLEDAVGVVEGNTITVKSALILDPSSLIPTFSTGGSKVYVGNELQTSGVSAQNFTSPVSYTVEKNTYKVQVLRSKLPVVYIDTPGNTAITSKTEWTANTTITIYNTDGSVDYTDTKLNIRGRGNSTWGYPKKPYALKLNKKASILGMPKHKRWVLLANWMDRTLLRNDVTFQISKLTGLEWTPRGQFVEVVLNGVHVGNYYLCEQIKIDENRVNVAEMIAEDISGDAVTGGYLMELDVYYDEVNKFKSSVRNLPYMFKEPDEEVLQPQQLAYFQNYINEMETSMYSENWLQNREYEDYMDLASFVDWWFVYELAKNGEPGHPKSCYMHKDRLGKLVAGPVWDFDWGTFTPGTGYTIKTAIYYGRLFSNPEFVELVKSRWALLKPAFDTIPDYIRSVAETTHVSNDINISLWPISSTVNGDESLSFTDAIERMVNSYTEKCSWLDSQINAL